MQALKAHYRRHVPQPVRATLRRVITDLPIRCRDLGADLRDVVSSRGRLPPASLRRRVGRSSARNEFISVGKDCLRDVLSALDAAEADRDQLARWLDFGCGCGRFARHLETLPFVDSVTGIDPDAPAIHWCQKHLEGEYLVTAPTPPTPLADNSFDAVIVVSVFTHLDESSQNAWLSEIHRLLRPGGLLIATTHAPDLLHTRPDLPAEAERQLDEQGFLFAPGFGKFNDDSSFHSAAYLRSVWGEHFTLCVHRAHGLGGFQDLSVWQKPRKGR